MQTKNLQNIISVLPISNKTKFISNKEISLSENLKKLKLKLPNGKDLGEMKIIFPIQDEKLQTKIITMSEIGQNSEKPLNCSIKSLSGENKKLKVKTVVKIFKKSSLEKQLQESEDVASKMKIQIRNNNHSFSNTTQNSKLNLSRIKKISNMNKLENIKQQFLIKNTESDIKKLIIKNPSIFDQQNSDSKIITIKNFSKCKKLRMMQKDNSQDSKSIFDKLSSLKPLPQKCLNSHNLKKNFKKVLKNSSNKLIRKRNNSCKEHLNNYKDKKTFLEICSNDLKIHKDTKLVNVNGSKTLKLDKSILQIMNKVQKKNVMVIVPTETAQNLTTVNNSKKKNELTVQGNKNNIIFTVDHKLIEMGQLSENSSNKLINTFINKQITFKSNKEEKELMHVHKSNDIIKSLNNTNVISQDLLDKFRILKKALLSVQDPKLQTKALRALKNCGIKVKKTIPIQCSTTSKVINEYQTQTKVFSLLKNCEFTEATNELDDIIQIKQNCKLLKQSICTLFPSVLINNVYLYQDKNEFNLDTILDKIFPGNKGINIKKIFIKKKIVQAKVMLKQILMDFKAIKNYDDNGLLGIHRAVINENIQEVQKYIMMLKATKQSLDICSLDNKTSLELSIEFEVNPQIIKILLDAGAQPVISKLAHDSALIIAAKRSSKLLPLLLKYINQSNYLLLNAKNSDGLAAIHYCAQYGNLEGIIDLLNHGAKVNLQDERSGRTALFYAIETKNTNVPQEIYNEIAHKLLENGAISNIPIFSKHNVLSLIDDVKSHTLKIALNKAVK